MFEGSCLCGAFRFTLDGGLRSSRYCHCQKCSKFTGTSPAAWAMADSAGLAITKSEAEIGKYNSGRGIRCFCTRCGSPLWFESIDYPEIVAIPLGVLDGGNIPAPELRLWVSSNPDWCAITDDLPQYATHP